MNLFSRILVMNRGVKEMNRGQRFFITRQEGFVMPGKRNSKRHDMKRGDLVLIREEILNLGEPRYGLFWDDSVDHDEWGYLPGVECTLFWNTQFIPFSYDDLTLLREVE